MHGKTNTAQGGIVASVCTASLSITPYPQAVHKESQVQRRRREVEVETNLFFLRLLLKLGVSQETHNELL